MDAVERLLREVHLRYIVLLAGVVLLVHIALAIHSYYDRRMISDLIMQLEPNTASDQMIEAAPLKAGDPIVLRHLTLVVDNRTYRVAIAEVRDAIDDAGNVSLGIYVLGQKTANVEFIHER